MSIHVEMRPTPRLPRRRARLLAGAALGIIAIGFEVQAVMGTPAQGANAMATSWAPTSEQIDAIRPRLILSATYDDPEISDAAASQASSATSWPSNVTSVEVLGSDRQGALSLMGDQGAVDPSDVRKVLLVQLSGTFIARDASTPEGAAPLPTFKYFRAAIDVSTGMPTDFGEANTSMDMSSPNTVQVPVSAAK